MNYNTPTFLKLRQVVMIDQLGSLTAASRMLAISQPALTKSVADFESMLGTKIFERHARGVRPTEAGQKLVEGAKRILADTENLLEQLQDRQNLRGGRLRTSLCSIGRSEPFPALIPSSQSRFARAASRRSSLSCRAKRSTSQLEART